MARKRSPSRKRQLLKKSKEAALAAVQIFNNPHITFKSEVFIVLMVIAWTYLLHAYYHSKKINYRIYKDSGKRYKKTKRGSCIYWGLEKCLNASSCPLDKDTKNNLVFLIGIRHEIEHQMTTSIDGFINAKFQACCINYNYYINDIFGSKYALENHLPYSLQFSAISTSQLDQLNIADLPRNIAGFIEEFEGNLTESEFNSPRFVQRYYYIRKNVNSAGQADQVIEFIPPDDPRAEGLNKKVVIFKDREKDKYTPTDVYKLMQKEGYIKFSITPHTKLWKREDAKNKEQFGVEIAGRWFWYETWIDFVRKHCEENKDIYI